MIKIVLIAIAIGGGDPEIFSSQKTWDTKEACQADLKAAVAEALPIFQTAGKQIRGAGCATQAEIDELLGKPKSKLPEA